MKVNWKKALAFVLLPCLLLTACGQSSGTVGGDASELQITGTVTETSEGRFTVQVSEDCPAAASSYLIVVHLGNAEILEESDHAPLTITDLTPDCSVRVVTDGGIMESYPAQVNALKVFRIQPTSLTLTGSIVIPLVELPNADFTAYTGFSLGGLEQLTLLTPQAYTACLYDENDPAKNVASVHLPGEISRELHLRVGLGEVRTVASVGETFSHSQTVTVPWDNGNREIDIVVENSDYNVFAHWQIGEYVCTVYAMNCTPQAALPAIRELASCLMIAVP